MKTHPLTPAEKHIIEDGGTEPPHSGQYDQHWQAGTYLCKRCHTPLYTSDSKFDAHCGWPSFDQEIPGRVTRAPNPNSYLGYEITCSTCGAHLGHVFQNEAFTPKNTRHCVNSLSLIFKPT